MKKYEAMVIVKPDLNDDEKKNLFNQINDAITKLNGKIVSSAVWSEKRKFFFTIKKYKEGVYYLVNFTMDPASVNKVSTAYKLNENILRVLITGGQEAA
ncbi:MAG: 30S ribosomal protein S6 [Candidatus Omnitrophica bacterium]|nr:30S ribosomal protein S6 [Candidatus Omnitrophota bacterium]